MNQIIIDTSKPQNHSVTYSFNSQELVAHLPPNVSIEEIAKQLQRTVGSIKTRLIVKALMLIDEDHTITLENAADRYKITTQDIQTYQANKKKRQISNTLRNNPVNLNTIYALLLEINNKLS